MQLVVQRLVDCRLNKTSLVLDGSQIRCCEGQKALQQSGGHGLVALVLSAHNQFTFQVGCCHLSFV